MTRIISLTVSVQLCKSIQQPLVVFFLTLSLLAIILVHHRSHLSIAREIMIDATIMFSIYFILVSLNRFELNLLYSIIVTTYFNILIFYIFLIKGYLLFSIKHLSQHHILHFTRSRPPIKFTSQNTEMVKLKKPIIQSVTYIIQRYQSNIKSAKENIVTYQISHS